MGAVAFQLIGAAKRYAGARATVFRDVDLELGRGELLVLLGSSGCGKSTLLRCLAGLEPFSAGELSFERPGATAVGIAFQEPRLMPWLDVLENVELGLHFRRNRAAAADADGRGLLAELGLAELAQARPRELSGGQAQRVSLARAVITRPDVLLLDEPFGALDPRTRRELQAWLLELKQRRQLSVLLVTHDVDEAVRLGDRVLLMSRSAGNVTRSWRPAEYDDSARAELRTEILACFPAGRRPAEGALLNGEVPRYGPPSTPPTAGNSA